MGFWYNGLPTAQLVSHIACLRWARTNGPQTVLRWRFTVFNPTRHVHTLLIIATERSRAVEVAKNAATFRNMAERNSAPIRLAFIALYAEITVTGVAGKLAPCKIGGRL